VPALKETAMAGSPKKRRRIAVEEAFSIPEVADGLRDVVRAGGSSLDLLLLGTVYDAQPTSDYRGGLKPRLLDVDDERIADMDRNGVDVQVLSLTAPGVQMFDADRASDLAVLANDRLAEAIARHPGRYAGLASFAPHAPERAVREMERAITRLKLNGFIVNSHTNNEYLDQPKFWPILEAAEALDRVLYIHPRAASDGFAAPLRDYGMDAACWGYGMETGTHAVRILLSGVLDRFPKLQICIGHMGEAVHFWLWRIEFMNKRAQVGGRAPKLKLTPTEYFQRNFTITTSGVEDPLALDYSLRKLGPDNVMWAIDYPYQPTPPAVAFMDQAPVTEDVRAKLYAKNAERVFKIAAA
jgi:2,3-dihydroxybenzoate decarboxylase/5-carboxyvanillate decarboxylase